MNDLDKIIGMVITEEINHILISEDINGDIRRLITTYYEDGKKKHLKRKPRIRTKKGRLGAKEYYDYDIYEKLNRKISKADADSIRNMIDLENTDIAAIARKIFPRHTEEGAQSQLRKILNGERPMTKIVARKLLKMISRGQIAVK